MSKSLGNNILPNELFSGENKVFSKAYDPNTIRFFFLQAHYRNELDISESAIQASEKGLKRIIEMLNPKKFDLNFYNWNLKLNKVSYLWSTLKKKI